MRWPRRRPTRGVPTPPGIQGRAASKVILDDPVNAEAEPTMAEMHGRLRAARQQADEANARARDADSQLQAARTRARYFTLGDLDEWLKAAGLERGIGDVAPHVHLDARRGDKASELHIVVELLVANSLGSRFMSATEDNAVATERRRYRLLRGGGLEAVS